MGNRQAQRRQNRDAIRAAIEASMAEAPLPLGWDQATSKGITYYIDHLNQTTTFNDPRLASSRTKKKTKKKSLPKYKRDAYSKAQFFLAKIHQIQQDDGQIEIIVSRENLFEDSFKFISTMDAFTLTRRLFIKFENEEGLDYGGMSREWFLALSQEIFKEERHLFKRSTDGYCYNINRYSHKNEQHLKHFHFIGIVLGMAVYHGKLLHSYFSIPFYKALMERKIELSDLKYEHPEVYKSMQQLLTAEDVSSWDLDFTYTVKDEDDKDVLIELKEGGKDVALTNENREEFVDLVVQYYFKGTEKQMGALKEGFQLFVPLDLLSEFEPEEIEMQLCGNTEIDTMDLKENTEYDEGYSESSPVIKFFWEVLTSLTQDELKNFLRFTTGSNKVPVGGFAHLYGSNGPQKFRVVPKVSSGLPTAHSCFNRLELSVYTDKGKLKKDLLYAINETSGFGLE